MSAVAGLLKIANASQSLDAKGDLVGEYQEAILVRNAKGMNAGSTLFGLMARLKQERAENTEFNWFERDPVRRQIYANDTKVGVAPGTIEDVVLSEQSGGVGNAWPYLHAGQVLRNVNTGEYLQVNTTPTSNTVSLVRGINQSSGTTPAISPNDTLVIVTLGQEEGALPVRAVYEEPEVITNYIQTFNQAVELTNAFKANKLRSDSEGPLKARRIQALERIAKDIEGAFLLGVRRRVQDSNGWRYYTGGVYDALVRAGLSSNVLNGNGTSGVSIDTFVNWLESFMTYGSDAKLALCGPRAFSAISRYANSADHGFRITGQESVWGMNITTIVTPFGELSLSFHPLLKEIPSLSDWMFVVDLAHVVQKVMEPLFLEPNIQQPGQDAYKEQFRAKLGLKLRFANAFGVAHNLQILNP